MSDKIAEGELAVRLTQDIAGGLGNHKKGKVLRNLTISSFTTLTGTGFGEEVKPGSAVSDGVQVDASQPGATPVTDAGKGG